MKRLWPLMLLTGCWTAWAADGPAGSDRSAAERGDGDVSRLQLRPRALASGSTVRLADVLSFAQADSQLTEQIADRPVAQSSGAASPAAGAATKVIVTHEQVVLRLNELGVNLARVLVSGALKCEVTIQPPTPPPAPPAGSTNAELYATGGPSPLLRPAATTQPAGASTLADVVRAHVSQELSALGESAEVTFERAGQEYLKLTTPPLEFSIANAGGGKLGLREFRVAIRQNGQSQQTARLFAQVRVVRKVLVALRPLSIGNTIRKEDLGFETRVFDREGQLGVTRVEEVIGQEVKRFVPGGEMVQADALRARALVRRLQPVTVVGANESVRLQLTGESLDSGSYGDSVRVRVGDGRRKQQVLQAVVTGVGTVRLAEGEL